MDGRRKAARLTFGLVTQLERLWDPLKLFNTPYENRTREGKPASRHDHCRKRRVELDPENVWAISRQRLAERFRLALRYCVRCDDGFIEER